MNKIEKTLNGGVCKTMNILCATDDNYTPYCGVMLTSFLENHKAFHTEVYIIVKNRLKAEKKLKRLENLYNVNVNIVEFPFNDVITTFPISCSNWTIETYYRLFVAELLPANQDRVLYLDCDIIVDGDVSEMYFSDMEEVSVLVCSEPTLEKSAIRLGYNVEEGYFNAGMMFININFWRKHRIMKRCIEYIKDHHDILTYNDQDVLNYVLHDSKRFISIDYNLLIIYTTKGCFESLNPEMQQKVRTCSPRMIHFHQPKPWSIFSYKFPPTAIWNRYCKMSLWRLPVFKQLPREKPFNYFIKRYFLWPFGIKSHSFQVIDEWK